MRDLRLDIRYAARALRAAPASTLSAIATLALGVAMTTSIFSVVNGVVLHSLPFPGDDRLVTLCEQYPGATADWCSISPPNVEDIAERSKTIEAIGIGRGWPFSIEMGSRIEPISGGLATPGLFRALGVKAERGRLIEKGDLIGRPSSVAVLTHETWQSRFGGREDILGRVVKLDTQSVVIVGVLQPGFQVPRFRNIEIWRPVHINPRDENQREWRGFVSFARLAPGVSIGAARRELAVLAAQLRAEHFTRTAGWDITLVTTRDLIVGRVKPMLYVFLGAVAVVLLIGCANIANLLLARSIARGREMALRSALGASRGRIVRSLLVESFLLALVGGSLGVALAFAATRAFKTLAPPAMPRVALVAVDGRVLLFALVLTVATTFVFGLLPALRAARVDLANSLREGGRGTATRRGWLSAALVIGELALAVTLVAGAGLVTRSFVALMSWQPGFEQEHLLTFTMSAPSSKYPFGAPVVGLWRRLESELASIPGVAGVGTASSGPLFGGRETWEMEIGGRAAEGRRSVRWADVSPNFFATLGVPLLRGRALNEEDVRDGPLVGIVNETLARQFWPNDDPLGKTLSFIRGTERATFTVVGVVRDVPPMRPNEPVEPQLYWSNRQLPRPFTFFLVRTSVPPASVAASIRSRVKEVDRDLNVSNLSTFEEQISGELTTPRFSMLLVTSFGFAALFFAAVGTYGLLAYVVSQRRREIGIRLALGAQRGQILGSVMAAGLRLAVAGVVLGLLITFAGTRLLRTLVVGVSVTDPISLGGAAVVLLAVGALACLAPAWRASRVDPALALANE